jgi:hypothetical protein
MGSRAGFYSPRFPRARCASTIYKKQLPAIRINLYSIVYTVENCPCLFSINLYIVALISERRAMAWRIIKYTLVRIRESSAGYTPTPSDSTKGLALFLFESRVSALNP